MKTIDIAERLRAHVASCMDQPWMDWPTVRDLARRYRVTQDDIMDMVETDGDLDMAVGMRTYNGVGSFDRPGDYRVEYIGEEVAR